MNSDEVSALSERLDALGDDPIGSHPSVLDEVHRALVGELERLAGIVRGEARSRQTGPARHHR